MSDKGKKIFLALSIIVPFLVYCVYYYGHMFKNAPYKFTEFESLTFKYGTVDSLVNVYDSKTGTYTYLNNHDSLVTKHVWLSEDDKLYLHRKAANLGFWDFPQHVQGPPSADKSVPAYYIEYRYKRKSKSVYFDMGFDGDIRLRQAAKTLVDELEKTINDAETRSGR